MDQRERLRRHEYGSAGKLGTLPPPPQRWEGVLAPQAPEVSSNREIRALSTPEYLRHIHELTVNVITTPGYCDPETGYISDAAWKSLVDGGLLASSLDDRDHARRQEEIMWVGRMLSYYDISLGLTYGITTALAIMPLQRFGTPEQQETYLTRIRNGERFGLAITEENKSGSTALIMDSNYSMNDNGTTHLVFRKQFQGLTGNSGLIVAAVKNDASTKTVGLFAIPQELITTEFTRMMGLHGISYGINRGDITINTNEHLMTELSRKGLFDFRDMFIKSRVLFVGMTIGHQERMEKEAYDYANTRMAGDRLLINIPAYNRALERIKTRTIILDAMFHHTAAYRTADGESLLHADTRGIEIESASIKALSASYASRSAEERAMLMGGKAYYADNALQDFLDIWAFKVFEGAELMLESQTGQDMLRSKRQIEDGEFFDIRRARENLEEETREVISIIGQWKNTRGSSEERDIHEEKVGEIAFRMFALGCLDRELYDPDDFEAAKDLLNLEIQQLALEFNRIRIPGK